MSGDVDKVISSIVLSIIIPNYNSGELLRLTLASIFKTSLDIDFEVLIMDNLSVDDPLITIESFGRENVIFQSEKDFGIYDAMNKGIKAAKGKWLIFLGAGDEMLTENINQFPLHSCEFLALYGDVFLIQSSRVYDGEFSLLKLLKKNISHQAIFYQRSIFFKIGFFDTSYNIASDYIFNLQLFFKYYEFVKYYPVVVSNFLGLGVSDILRDVKFQDGKVRIINTIGFRNFSFSNFLVLLKYNIYYLNNYVRFKLRK